MNETWKDITINCNIYNGIYQVSSFGNVRKVGSLKLLKHYRTSSGYCRVELYSNGRSKKFFVHRLVANEFLQKENRSLNDVVNHKNHFRDDNHVQNLEWVTKIKNSQHGYKTIEDVEFNVAKETVLTIYELGYKIVKTSCELTQDVS